MVGQTDNKSVQLGSVQKIANRVSAEQKKQANIDLLKSQGNVKVLEEGMFPNTLHEPLAAAWVSGGEQTFLVITTMDSWVMTGCRNERILTKAQLIDLEMIRCYAYCTREVWERVKAELLEGKIYANRYTRNQGDE